MSGHEHTRLRSVRSPFHGDEQQDRLRLVTGEGGDDPPPPGGVVVGVDGSAAAAEALRWAVRHGERTGVAVCAVAVEEPAAAHAWLHGALVRAGAGRTGSGFRAVVRTAVRAGEPGAVLPVLARDAALLVLGLGRVDGTPGAVARRCLREARCPVVLVPPPEPGIVPPGMPSA